MRDLGLELLIGPRQRVLRSAGCAADSPKSLGHGGSRLLCWCAVRSATASPFATLDLSVATPLFSSISVYFFFLFLFLYVDSRWRFPIIFLSPFSPPKGSCDARSAVLYNDLTFHRGSASKCCQSSPNQRGRGILR